MEFIYCREVFMDQGHFYYINDQYFIDFPDSKLMQNKESINGQLHDRPCFYSFMESNTGIYWMIPFSSQVAKYQKYYNAKMKKNIISVILLYLEKY